MAQTVRWGLIPPWARELGKGFQPINAHSESAADKPPFAELWRAPSAAAWCSPTAGTSG